MTARLCQVCDAPLVREQKVACSKRCAATLNGAIGRRIHGDATREQVRLLWLAGELSASRIGQATGMTKNAVVGLAHRLGLPARLSPFANGHGGRPPRARPVPRGVPTLPPLVVTAAPKRPRKPGRPRAVSKPPPAPRAVPEPVQTGGRQCAFLLGERPYRFCEAVAAPGYPYCAEHCRVSYVHWPLRRTAGVEAVL